jgi:hypothetical protein
MEEIHCRSKGSAFGAVQEGVTLDQRMKQGRGFVEIRRVEFDCIKGCERSGHSCMQQGSISHALQSAAASGDDALVDLMDPNEQATDNIGIISHALCPGL